MSKYDAARHLLFGQFGSMTQQAISEAIRENSSARIIFDHSVRVIERLIPDPKLIYVTHKDGVFTVDQPSLAGSPPVGRGRSIDAALADWLRYWACEVGVIIRLDETAEPFEMIRRVTEERKR